MTHRRRRATLLALSCASGVLFGAPGPGGRDAAARGAPASPSPDERVDYWLARILRGPEESSFKIPNFHQGLLSDAERNLVVLGERTLSRLADAGLRERTQANPDANAWHALLRVLAVLGPKRPEVARAWAAPALGHDLLTLRREALPVLQSLADPADGELVLAALARDVDDRLIGAMATRLLLSYGPPWVGRASRTVLERGVADLPDLTSTLWNGMAVAISAAPGGREDDALAWWALLSEPAGPRAPWGARPGRPVRPADAEGGGAVRLDHAVPSGRMPAAAARDVLARHGHAAALASARLDLASGDPALVATARRLASPEPTAEERASTRETAARFAAMAAAGDPLARPTDAKDLVASLAADPSPEATARLAALLAAFPAAPAWRDAIVPTYEALAARNAEPVAYVGDLLRSAQPLRVELALFLVRREKSRAYIPVLSAWMDDASSAPWRAAARRDLAFLYAVALEGGGLPAEEVAAFARTLRGWGEDPSDPSAAGLLGALLDLGPAGEAQVADGLAGPRRDLYVAVLSQPSARYVGVDVVRALLAPLTPTSSATSRRAALAAAFFSASSASAPVLEDLARRLPEGPRADVETVLRIVRQRDGGGP